MVIANGRPLLYFDSASYLDQGARFLGLATPAAAPPATAAPEAKVPPAPDKKVSGSRSFVYALFVGILFAATGLPGVVAANLAAICAATWLLARALAAALPPPRPALSWATIGLLAASAGSLPFYVAFVMPDIFAPILILMVALLFSHARSLNRAEKTAAVLLALFSIVVHPSHLLLIVALAPVALLLSPAATGRRLSYVLVIGALLVGAGLAERVFFRIAVERVLHRQVVDLPFLTARLIDDGPGLAYLAARCPDPAYPTCALFQVLQTSADPARLDAPNILFSRTPERGSYRRLSPDQELAVARHQTRFAADVVMGHPVGVAGAVLRNILIQLGYFSVEMTAPTEGITGAVPNLTSYIGPEAAAGRMLQGFAPYRLPLYVLHGVVYAVSLLVLAGLFAKRRLSPQQASLALIVLAGILLNAAICGAVSEPAHRYGARVMFLLPMLAAMLWLASAPPRTPD